MTQAFLFVLLNLAAFSAFALNFQNVDGFANKIQGVDESGAPCSFSYVVDKGFFLGRETSSVTMSVFSDQQNANPSMILDTAVFQDSFITGKAFSADYRLPEFSLENYTITKQGGQNSLTYLERHEFRRYDLRTQVDFIFDTHSKLEEVRVDRLEERWGPDSHQTWVCRF